MNTFIWFNDSSKLRYVYTYLCMCVYTYAHMNLFHLYMDEGIYIYLFMCIYTVSASIFIYIQKSKINIYT